MNNLPTLANIDVTVLKGVGSKLAQVLAKLDIHSVQDLLFHLPLRYLDRTRITAISQLRTNTSVVVQGAVLKTNIVFGKRRSLAVTIEDNSGTTCLRFYHFNASQKNSFEEGRQVRCYGDPRLGSSGLEFYHPEYEFVDSGKTELSEQALTPLYPLTDGLSQSRIRSLTEQAVNLLKDYSPSELLPAEVQQMFGMDTLASALAYLHFPPPEASVEQILAGQHPAQQRLAFEELLAHYLVRQQLREQFQQEHAALIKVHQDKKAALLSTLPFSLTGAQQRVCDEIQRDLSKGVPMLRMVQGDVGSGKTLVAAIAALNVAFSGYQVAIVAPTEILAEQHLNNFKQWLEPLGLRICWLVGKLTAAKRRDALKTITDGEAEIIVGTHALFQEDVDFAKLGLAIIDEQHRFGVDQRLSLRKKSRLGEVPHQLVMTATPIPRTLAMTAYSELDYSVIDELPPGRKPIQTALVSQSRRAHVIERIRVACEKGTQAYWVCPLVEDSETLSAANAEQTWEQLKVALSGFNIAMVHGRLKAAEKEMVMASFKKGESQLLVATTVIEVGVDVPNATLMIIENPERLGLAQLHQLRGRVGRGSEASHCVLLYGDKLSQHAKQRLQVLRESNDGFVIAEKDLEIRGPGELLGTRQTGDMQYRLADAQQHANLIPEVHRIGEHLCVDKELSDKLIQRWIGYNKNYAQV